VIFVETDVFTYAVGRSHPLKEEARAVFLERRSPSEVLVTSAEVLQELLHAYLAVNRLTTLHAALTLARTQTGEVWSVEAEDVEMARLLRTTHSSLSDRDLLHLACCRRRGIDDVRTYDRGLASVFGG